jgi:hypothetical protein
LRRIDAMFGKGRSRSKLSDEEAGEIAFRRIAKRLGVSLD